MPKIYQHLFVCIALSLAMACAEKGNGGSVNTEPEDTTSSSTNEAEDTNAPVDPTTQQPAGNSEGSPCTEEGARICESDAIYTCEGGQWVFMETCVEPFTCSFESVSCVE